MAVKEQAPLTTGQVARYCGVNFRTVIRWIERGHLKGYKLPGRGDNRVQVADFVKFLTANNMPVPAEFQTEQRVLVIDDDVSMAKAIQRVLKRAGFSVELAHSGFEAGAKLVDNPPALVTLDLNMPGMSGLDVLAQIRQRFADSIKVLVISGATDAELQAALDAGCDALLEKPFDNDELAQLARQLIGPGVA